jgi:hypothetical protein
MTRFLSRFVPAAAGLLLAFPPLRAPAGLTEYTEPGRTDFDTAIQCLNPYGTWSRIDGIWAYTPLDHAAPYSRGRWLYTDYGWYWAGASPISWATEHYGYWKRGADKVWSWFPGPLWLPQIVELRVTPTHIGWRSAQVDDQGNFVEEPEDRYAKADEWFFVTRAQFTRPITPRDAASPDQAARLLDDSTDSMHNYYTYRSILRPGPHPAEFLSLAGAIGIFAPRIYANDSVPPVTLTPAAAAASPSATPASDPTDADGTPIDPRQVPYWVTLSLPNAWTPRPADARPNEIYVYRPAFYQDQDGIERRVSLWIDPALRKNPGVTLHDLLTAKSKTPAAPAAATTTTTAPAAFRSEFETSFPGAAAKPATSTPGATTNAPTGRAAP